jgi:trk system potassium uptake protein TrkH
MKKIHISPFALPIVYFGGVIVAGTVLLHSGISRRGPAISWIDALFTATSATCVTGLSVVDTGTFFTRFGQSVIMALIQFGGLGIMTITGLIFYLWRQHVSLTDRVAVGQSLLHDPNFHLGQFLQRMVIWTLLTELVGAFLLYLQAPEGFPVYSAVFHAVSAFCNAGFSLNSDSLMAWRGHWGINFVFILLIVLGGLGFSVLLEIQDYFRRRIRLRAYPIRRLHIGWYSRVVLQTTLFLIIAGWAGIYFAEFIGFHKYLGFNEGLLSALFQSVTCRTAGFNTLDIGKMTNVALLVMIMLMFIGGSPGSCAGGIKITTFRVLMAFVGAQVRGRRQTVIGRFAVDHETVNKSLILIFFAMVILSLATLGLTITEGGDIPHPATRGLFFEIVFEAVSAFGTVGLSTGLTPSLTVAGKSIITLLMFIGRLGPILFLAAIQNLQQKLYFRWPEESMLVG